MPALQTLDAIDPDPGLVELKHQLTTLSKHTAVVLQWIPAHSGIKGNEKADKLAKEGTKLEQPITRATYRETRTLIKHRWNTSFTNAHTGYNPHQDPRHLLPRSQQTTIFRLRTGHCRLKAHLRRIGVAESAQCDCEGEQTPAHVLQTCRLLNHLQAKTWPCPLDLRSKLWGDIKHLMETSQFMAQSGLPV